MLRRLADVSEVAQLICYDVVFSQEGVLLIMVLQRGETNISKYLENTKQLSRSAFFFLWEGILGCISALHRRLKNILTLQNISVILRNIIHMDIKTANFVLIKAQIKVVFFVDLKTVYYTTLTLTGYRLGVCGDNSFRRGLPSQLF